MKSPKYGRAIPDTNWLRHNFLYEKKELVDIFRERRSNGWAKYTDTTLGGNFAINAPYQFCRYADIKEERFIPEVSSGMGRWYSENIDDYGHNVHFRVGVPAYSNILSYINNAIDGQAAIYAATGRDPVIFSTLGWVTGAVLSIAFWEITLLATFLTGISAFAASARYMYLTPTMYQYWKTVQTLVSTIASNLSLLPGSTPATADKNGPADSFDQNLESLPDVFRRTAMLGSNINDINVHAIAGRAERLRFRQQQAFNKEFNNTKSWTATLTHSENTLEGFRKLAESIENTVKQTFNESGVSNGLLLPNMHYPDMISYYNAFRKAYAKSMEKEETGIGQLDKSYLESLTDNINSTDKGEDKSNFVKKFWEENVKGSSFFSFEGISKAWKRTGAFFSGTLGETIMAEARDGSQWVSFRTTNALDSVSESVSNSLETSNIVDAFNNISGHARNLRFMLGGDNPISGMINMAVDGVASFMAGAGETNHVLSFLNPLVGLAYGAQLENPKKWGSSSSTMPTANFKFVLRLGYANKISYLQDIIVPLCMLMAMSFPRGTGAHSYGSPFYVQFYNKGRSQASIGMVTSLNITRGTGNAPWLKSGLPTAVEVDMTIETLDEQLYVPIASGMPVIGQLKQFTNLLQHNSMGEYTNVLAGLGLVEQEYIVPNLRKRIGAFLNAFNEINNGYAWASWGRSTVPGKVLSMMSDVTARR